MAILSHRPVSALHRSTPQQREQPCYSSAMAIISPCFLSTTFLCRNQGRPSQLSKKLGIGNSDTRSCRRTIAVSMASPSARTGKIVVITGVTKGLGKALAFELAARGHTIAGCGRSEDKLSNVQAGVEGKHLFKVVDVASDTSVKDFSSEVISNLGVPDIVVNCAGIINKNAKLWEVPAEEFNQVVAANLYGTVNVIRHFVPHLIRRGGGVVVNFSSGWGRSAAAEVAPYCATKWAVEGLTKSLAKEVPPGLTVVSLNPGVINTAMLQSCFGASASMYPTPEDWAPACANLILQLNPSNNGASLSV